MTELEDRLRAMLHERATDIDAPPSVPASVSRPAAAPARGNSHRPRAWLLSAAVVGAVAIGPGALLVGADSHDDTVGKPTPSATVPVLPAAGPPAPTRLDPAAVGGYSVRGRVTVGGVSGYRAEVPQFRSGRATGPDTVDSIAWQFAPNRWAIIQKITSAVAADELPRLASALRPVRTEPYTVPFRFAVPASAELVEVYDNRPYYPQTLKFTAEGDTILVQVRGASERTSDKRGWTPLLVDGLRGYLDPAEGGYVEFDGGVLTVRAMKNGGELDTAVVEAVLGGLRWSGAGAGAGGAGPAMPLRTALGG